MKSGVHGLIAPPGSLVSGRGHMPRPCSGARAPAVGPDGDHPILGFPKRHPVWGQYSLQSDPYGMGRGPSIRHCLRTFPISTKHLCGLVGAGVAAFSGPFDTPENRPVELTSPGWC